MLFPYWKNPAVPCAKLWKKANDLIRQAVSRELGIDAPEPDLTEWIELVERIKSREKVVNIALVGKYVQLHDAYLSVAEAMQHAGYTMNADIHIHWVDSEKLTETENRMQERIKAYREEAEKEYTKMIKSKVFREMQNHYNAGLFPYCPECKKQFDPTRIAEWSRRLEQTERKLDFNGE